MPLPRLTWLLGVALLAALPLAARAGEDAVPPRPDRNPLSVSGKKAAKPVLPGDAPTVPWSDAEIADAKTKCAKLLKGLALDYEPLTPIKQGRCGAPAPILLRSVGSNPKVEISPPATVTCAVAKALSTWLARTVQPAARETLGAPVVKLSNASSYVCRNRYGGAATPLSEHALANALDISEFVIQSGGKLTVLASWPHALSAPGASASTEITASITRAMRSTPKTVMTVNVANATTTMVTSNPFVVTTTDARTNPFVLPAVASNAPLPKPPAEAAPPLSDPLPDRRAAFVTKIHDDACNTFGTVLGPNANAAHKNHFHLDMKARRHKAFCE
jgi:hypothetical protein